MCVVKAPPPDFPAPEPIEEPIPEPEPEPLAETAPPQETRQPIEEDVIIPEEIEKAETVKINVIFYTLESMKVTTFFCLMHLHVYLVVKYMFPFINVLFYSLHFNLCVLYDVICVICHMCIFSRPVHF